MTPTIFAITVLLSLAAFPAQPQAATPTPKMTVFAPRVIEDRQGERVEGAVCRQGPTPVLNIKEIKIFRLDAAGEEQAAASQPLAVSLRERGPSCAFYAVRTAWQIQLGESVRVCVEGAGGTLCARSRN